MAVKNDATTKLVIKVVTGTTEGDTASQLDVLMTMADMDWEGKSLVVNDDCQPYRQRQPRQRVIAAAPHTNHTTHYSAPIIFNVKKER